MAKKEKTAEVNIEEEEEVYPLVYNQYVTINDNHGTIILKQTGKPGEDDPPPGTGG